MPCCSILANVSWSLTVSPTFFISFPCCLPFLKRRLRSGKPSQHLKKQSLRARGVLFVYFAHGFVCSEQYGLKQGKIEK